MLPNRDLRLAEAIRESLDFLFQMEMQDPRLPESVSITRVEVSRDLKNANVYYYHTPEDKKTRSQMEELLEDAGGFIRGYVTKDISSRLSPMLSFHFDPAARHAQRVNQLLQQVRPTIPPETPPGEDESDKNQVS